MSQETLYRPTSPQQAVGVARMKFEAVARWTIEDLVAGDIDAADAVDNLIDVTEYYELALSRGQEISQLSRA